MKKTIVRVCWWVILICWLFMGSVKVYRATQAERPPVPPSRIRVWARMDGCTVYQVSLRNDYMGYFVKCDLSQPFALTQEFD